MGVLSENQVEEYQKNGYLIIDTEINNEALESIKKDLAPYWNGETTPTGVSYFDQNRIQDAWKINNNILALAISPKILKALEQLYRLKPMPFQTLNFFRGTEQRPHSDSIHFNSKPFGLMCGVWIALEDIGKDQGPLIYYPESQMLPEMNYKELGLPVAYNNGADYEDSIQKVIEEHNFKAEYAIMKKGQALIWSANILHGGSKQNDKSLTRQSQVTHYYFEGAKCWRPSASSKKVFYFEPNWIPYPGSPIRMRIHPAKIKNQAIYLKNKVINIISSLKERH